MIPSPVFAAVHVLPDPPLAWWTFIISTVVKMIVVFTVYMVGVAMLTLAERKISAWIQGRLGPNRVGGTLGLLQPAADGVKNIMKEETLPAHVNKPIFMLAPGRRRPSFRLAPRGTRGGAASRWSSPTCPSASCSSWRSRR